METFKLPNSDPPCAVSLPADLTEAKVMGFKPFTRWISTLQKSISSQSNTNHPFHSLPYKLRSIRIQSVDFFGERIGFLKLKAEVTNDKGDWLPGAVFMRGPSVTMLIVLQPHDAQSEDEKYVILTVQARVAAAAMTFTELPAGMLDDGTFAGTAAKEIEEECGLKVPESELINLTALALSEQPAAANESDPEVKLGEGIYPSPGACDEFIPIFLYQKKVSRNEIEEWQGKLTGLREEGEKITLKIVKLQDLWKEGARDAKALSALALYTSLKQNGNI